MRKFLLPIINLVNVILVSITFGLANNPGATDPAMHDAALPNFYNLVWGHQEVTNIYGIVAFFLFVVAVALTVICFIPGKARKVLVALTGLMYIGAGVLFLLTPAHYCYGNAETVLELSGSLIAMAVLVFVAGALSLLMCVVESTEKKAK